MTSPSTPAELQSPKRSPLSLFPELALGILFGAILDILGLAVFDPPEALTTALLVLPCLGAVLGAAVAARRIRRRRSMDELLKLKKGSLRWSLVTLLLGPAVGMAWAIEFLGARWHFVTMAKFAILGTVAGLVMSMALAVAGLLLCWPAKDR